jgi:hypothetical protein
MTAARPTPGPRLAALAATAIGAAAWLSAGSVEAQSIACRSRPVAPAECFAPTQSAEARCRRTPLKPAACFTVHARLSVANGTPSFRLWPVGGHRLFGVFGADGDPASPALLPGAVEAIAQPPTPGTLRSVVGDFSVCPLARSRPGWMQPVCIAGAGHLFLVGRLAH